MRLTKNFRLNEFTRSRTAVQQDISEQFSPPGEVIDNLVLLTRNVLQPLRTELNTWMYITSGYRCERLNTAVGGSTNSDHMRGMAADITCKDTKALYELCLKMNLPFKQLIYYSQRNFVHISYDNNEIRRQSWVQG